MLAAGTAVPRLGAKHPGELGAAWGSVFPGSQPKPWSQCHLHRAGRDTGGLGRAVLEEELRLPGRRGKGRAAGASGGGTGQRAVLSRVLAAVARGREGAASP